MKSLFGIFSLLMLSTSWAENSDAVKILKLNESDVDVSCEKNNFIVRIAPMASITKSRLEKVIYCAPTAAVCSAIQSQFRLKQNTKASIRIDIRSREETISISPCEQGNCQGEFKYYDLESVYLELEGIPLSGKKIIPESVIVRTSYWESGECPPWAQSCGL